MYLQFFMTKIAEDFSLAIREYFRPVPDEFVTGSDLLQSTSTSFDNTSLDNSLVEIKEGMEQVDVLITSLGKIVALLEKSTNFGFAKQDDMKALATELKSVGSHGFQQKVSKGSSYMSSNWTVHQDTFVQVVDNLNDIGSKWKGYAENYELLVLEPLKMLKVSILHLIAKISSMKSPSIF